MRPQSPRRTFIRQVALGTVAVATPLAGCGGGDSAAPAPSPAPANAVKFLHGVASGDPLATSLVIWTRATPEQASAVELSWEVASDSAFTQIVKSGTLSTDASRDYTAKVDVTGLAANTLYYYRFAFAGVRSPVGRGKTLPTGNVAQVKLAVFSCSNFPAGYFNVYADAASLDDVDAALHLGDYIYEYDKDGYASQQAAALGRVSEPANETLTLADYRKRHAQYKTDPNLQAAHAKMPFITVWDDHEIANDTYEDGAENHTPATEGSFAERRAAALQAYYEWMPLRQPDAARPERIYRSFDFGNLASLHMLDTRLVGRDLQLELTSYVGANGAFDATKFTADISNPARELLGAEQNTWLHSQLSASTATWQVLGQQVLMGRMNLPAPILLQQITVSGYGALVAKAQATPALLTDAEKAILAAPAIPYNLDAWDGYAAAREAVLTSARTQNKNLVVLAGDTHNAWASDLADASGNAVGVEFATPSVSSPGLETFFPAEPPAVLAAGVETLIGPLQYTDTSQRGFMLITLTPTEVRADWRYVNTINSTTYTAAVGKSLRSLPGAGNRKIVPV